ncbi:MAG: hypothetical protein MUC36_23295 [Planctomycetes bacterium]|nr:hypothetical protein [Planctomycetota bacterium]
MRHLLPATLLLLTTVTAQSVLPPFDATYQIADLGQVSGVNSYGGTAFVPGTPNVLLVTSYPNTQIRAVPLTRNGQGQITGSLTTTVVATIGGSDGGLAFGPNNVLFATWYGPNRLSQLLPGSAVTNRVDDLTPLGVGGSVGGCTFVPAGLPGAGRCKVGSYSSNQVHDLPLTADGSGTFTPGTAGPGAQLQGGIEGLVYVPNGAPLIGGRLLVVEWGTGNIAAYQIDAIGDPIPSTRQVVVGAAFGAGGGAVDPITGDILFLSGSGRILALRNGAACGTFTAYGVATPGALGTPTIGASGCSRIGQTIQVSTTGPQNGIGLLALGSFPTNAVWNGLTVLQSLNATVINILGPTGQNSLALPIPVNPSLGNSRVYLQTAFLDASTASGFSASAGLDILIR